jgi:hypothetical protein
LIRSSLPMVLWVALAGCADGAASDTAVVDADGDGVAAPADCDDADPDVHPGATEVPYDGVDNDCDPIATPDEDLDGDGSSVAEDCDDADPAVHPGAEERCDGVDEDCDRAVDDDPIDGLAGWADLDGDGHGDPDAAGRFCADGWAANADDCDDADATTHAGAQETCDGDDDDCDGAVDEDGSDAPDWYPDADGDGYGAADGSVRACVRPEAHAATPDDCDDADPDAFPDAAERDDLADQDCDGLIDEDFVAVGDLVVTEIMGAPTFGGGMTDPSGEWFEVVNVSDRAVELSGWRVAREDDASVAAFRVDPALGLPLGAGARAVFCRSDAHDATRDPSSTLVCDYVWSPADEDASFTLDAAAATLVLSVGDTRVDAVAWSSDWPRSGGASRALDPAYTAADANDDAAAWCAATTDGGSWWSDGAATELGTPGAPNAPCR